MASGVQQSGKPGGTMKTKLGKGTAADGAKLLEYKIKAISMLDEINQPKLRTRRVFPPEFIPTVLSKMICQLCQRVPSPYIRYLCCKGHMFCGSCAEQRFLEPNAKCMIEMPKKELDFVLDASKKRVSSSLLPIPPVLTPDYWMEDTKTESLNICQETVCRYPADPIFTAIWTRAQWKCPAGCNKVFEGRMLLDHVDNCCYRGTNPGSNYRSESSRSDYANETSRSDENTLVLSRNLPGNNDLSASDGGMEIKQPVRCNVAGCPQQVLMKNFVEHLILDHHVNAMDASNDHRSWRATGVLEIPQAELKARRPFYTLIRCYHRFFLFCMEPATDNSYDIGLWIRRVSNKENKEEENGPCFTYNFVMMKNSGKSKMQICYKKSCTSWRKPSEEVFGENLCFQMPASYVLQQFLLNCVDEHSGDICGDGEKGSVYIQFSIMVTNSTGELYRNDGGESITSSMESLAVIDNDSYDTGIAREEDDTKDTTGDEDEDEQ